MPVIPEKGSVGASGDLAPLAHLALALLGEGEAFYEERAPAERERAAKGRDCSRRISAPRKASPSSTAPRRCTRSAASRFVRAKRLARVADVAGAMTLEALKGTPVAFDARIHKARPHPGQQAVARHLLALLRESEIRASHARE